MFPLGDSVEYTICVCAGLGTFTSLIYKIMKRKLCVGTIVISYKRKFKHFDDLCFKMRTKRIINYNNNSAFFISQYIIIIQIKYFSHKY